MNNVRSVPGIHRGLIETAASTACNMVFLNVCEEAPDPARVIRRELLDMPPEQALEVAATLRAMADLPPRAVGVQAVIVGPRTALMVQRNQGWDGVPENVSVTASREGAARVNVALDAARELADAVESGARTLVTIATD